MSLGNNVGSYFNKIYNYVSLDIYIIGLTYIKQINLLCLINKNFSETVWYQIKITNNKKIIFTNVKFDKYSVLMLIGMLGKLSIFYYFHR